MTGANKCLKIVLMLFVYILTACNQNVSDKDKIKHIQEVAGSISDRLVPDRREGIADINLSFNDGSVIIKGETDNPVLKTQIADSVQSMGYNLIDSVMLLPTVALGGINKGVAGLSVINLRIEPGHDSEMGSQALMGEPLKILKRDGSWILVQTPDKYISWAEAGSVEMMDETEWLAWKSASKIIYINRSGWIYKKPDSNDVISDVVAGCIMKKGAEKGAYIQAILPDGREGWVERKYIRDFAAWKKDLKPTAEGVLSSAEGLMGIPYLWGGSSAKGVDCSGLMQTAFFLNGIILSRDASLQALHGKPVNIENGWSELQKGDLLFFGSIRDSKPRVTHVAVYKGDSEYIHSATKVNVNSLDSTRVNYSSYRKNSFLLARRIIGSEGSDGITLVRDHSWY